MGAGNARPQGGERVSDKAGVRANAISFAASALRLSRL
jgi:hypothetical protein